ncbi:MAG: Dabb family protein [Pyrinomonadaceae bacterium]
MLVHIVCWKYKPEIDGDTRRDHREQLTALPGLVPGIESFDVGEDILHLDRSFDTGLVARFGDREALEAYTVHAEHQRVAAIGKDISQQTISVDFITGDEGQA